MTDQEPRVQQFTPDESWGWATRSPREVYEVEVDRQVLEARFGIDFTDPNGEWGDQPGPMKHALVNLDGTPVRLIEYDHPYFEGKTIIEVDEGAPIDETVLIDALGLVPSQVIWRSGEE